MTLEAVALHHLDNLDAKMHSFEQLMRDDPNVDSAWTQFHHDLGRKLFKGEPDGRASVNGAIASRSTQRTSSPDDASICGRPCRRQLRRQASES